MLKVKNKNFHKKNSTKKILMHADINPGQFRVFFESWRNPAEALRLIVSQRSISISLPKSHPRHAAMMGKVLCSRFETTNLKAECAIPSARGAANEQSFCERRRGAD